ncbi:hypothetical protein BSLG_010137 [Batrachochytrium salamandrivorans]|nr:hypothetical protein BSLG_010137 [Batrachochytrium salamandrivorans]
MGYVVQGLDRDLAEKAAAKYDFKREAEARVDRGCSRLANKTINSLNAKINITKMPFKQMENIGTFLQAMDKLGVPKMEQFQTVDLFEEKNLGQVVDSIFSFSRHAVKHGFNGPL